MKIIRLFVCSCLVLSLATAAFAAEEVRLGSVDFRKVAQESEAGKKAAGLLKEMTEKYQRELNAKGNELEKMKKSLEGKAKNLSQAKLQAKEKELQKKFQEYQEFGRNAEIELQKKQAELTDQLGEKLLKLVKEYGSKNGYVAIIRQDNLMYTDAKHEPKDLTDDILKLVNATDVK
jgi:outer membrane protein